MPHCRNSPKTEIH